MSIAAQLGIDPKPVLVAIAFGGSASFASPIGYQTNTMVMGPGGYFFRDYLRFGLPLNVLMWLTATCFIPVFWPA
jgi:di/tricarboxylate transporter